jgi:hypothetical protein
VTPELFPAHIAVAPVPIVPPASATPPPATSTIARLKQFLLAETARLDWTSFAELERRGQEAGFPMTGNTSLCMGHVNTVLWTNMSEEYFAAVQGLLEEKAVHLWPASAFTYLIDGCIPGIPEAKRPPRGDGYATPKWLPCCLRTVPPTTEKKQGQGKKR